MPIANVLTAILVVIVDVLTAILIPSTDALTGFDIFVHLVPLMDRCTYIPLMDVFIRSCFKTSNATFPHADSGALVVPSKRDVCFV